MVKLGKDISDKEIKEVMKKYDVDGDNLIELEEFKKMFEV
jgi:Ca2+-binding EF-hand superfamily protein